MKITIWHNIMWSRYKAAVFSSLEALCTKRQSQLKVYQIAETADQRTSLSPTDTSWHKYPYELLFEGSYESVPRLSLFWNVAQRTWSDDADVTILAGYDRPEYWIQALILLLRRKTFACFCDSTVYDNQQKLFTGILKRIFFSWCSGIFCYGQRAAEYVQLYGAPPEKIIHRCQAAALYEGYSPELALKRRLAMFDPSNPPRLLYVGRLSREKSIDHLILAFSQALPKMPGGRLVLVGGGPEEQQLKSLCAKLGVQESVDFTGPKNGEDLFSEYLRASALVLPSYSEPWGLVVNESLSHGCVVVVSDRCGCVPELVIDAETGYAFAWGDVDQLAQKMMLAAQLDKQRTSERCLEQIAPFNSENAARSILDGVEFLAQKSTAPYQST